MQSRREYTCDEGIQSSQIASLTEPITAEQRQALLAMTPLLFHVDQTKIDWSQLTEITIKAEILVGKAL
ncbi:Ribosomal RNA large subunit methyltransferase A [Streptococcus oralis]|uniref:Ribosomal RNA large subunit methyltransferase A n=1 Tax=Streptococcus oralis TaxID=1303 RepID=A0A139PCC3_STROR|nr:Ribosomal RNA large subunit methyltransferase A [Streptococcus oralis]